MFSDAKNNYFGENLGVFENKGCPKNVFSYQRLYFQDVSTNSARKYGPDKSIVADRHIDTQTDIQTKLFL